MSEDQTMEPAVEEGSQVSEPSEDSQVASEVPESAPAEGDSVEAAPQQPVDWWNPETWGDTPPKEVVNNIQKEYNLTSTRKAELEKEIARKADEQRQWETWAQQVIANPESYKQLRRQYGYNDEVTQAQSESPPKFKLDLHENATIDDLERQLATHLEQRDQYWAARYDSELAKRDKLYEDRITRSAQPAAQMKWDAAREAVKNRFGSHYASVEEGVLTQIVNGPYRNLYGTMEDDKLIEKVFKAEYTDQYTEYIQSQKSQEAKKRKATSTAKPSTPKKTSPKPKPGQGADAVIARLKANGY